MSAGASWNGTIPERIHVSGSPGYISWREWHREGEGVLFLCDISWKADPAQTLCRFPCQQWCPSRVQSCWMPWFPAAPTTVELYEVDEEMYRDIIQLCSSTWPVWTLLFGQGYRQYVFILTYRFFSESGFFPSFWLNPERIDGVAVCFGGELAHTTKHAATTSETKSQSEWRCFCGFLLFFVGVWFWYYRHKSFGFVLTVFWICVFSYEVVQKGLWDCHSYCLFLLLWVNLRW